MIEPFLRNLDDILMSRVSSFLLFIIHLLKLWENGKIMNFEGERKEKNNSNNIIKDNK